MLECIGCGCEDESYVQDVPVHTPEFSEISTRAPKMREYGIRDDSLRLNKIEHNTSPDRETLIQLRQNELVMRELRRERNQVLGELRQAKREIKMLRTEQGLNRNEIEKLRKEREAVHSALNGESRDALDSLFDW